MLLVALKLTVAIVTVVVVVVVVVVLAIAGMKAVVAVDQERRAIVQISEILFASAFVSPYVLGIGLENMKPMTTRMTKVSGHTRTTWKTCLRGGDPVGLLAYERQAAYLRGRPPFPRQKHAYCATNERRQT